MDVERGLPPGHTLARLAELSVEIVARRKAEDTARKERWEEDDPEERPPFPSGLIPGEIADAKALVSRYSSKFPGLDGMIPSEDEVEKLAEDVERGSAASDGRSIADRLYDRIVREACFSYDYRTKRIFGTTYSALSLLASRGEEDAPPGHQQSAPVIAKQPEPESVPSPGPAPGTSLEHGESLDDLVEQVKRALGPAWEQVVDLYGHEQIAIQDIDVNLQSPMGNDAEIKQAVEQTVTWLKGKLEVTHFHPSRISPTTQSTRGRNP